MKKKHRRKKKLTKHHIVNKIDKLSHEPRKIIMLRNEKHQCWHAIFKNLTFLEAARLLIRADNLKKGTHYKIVEVDNVVDNNVYCNCSACSGGDDYGNM